MLVYADDNNGQFPPEDQFYNALVPKYVEKKYFICPLREKYGPSRASDSNSDYIVSDVSHIYLNTIDDIPTIVLKDKKLNHSRCYNRKIRKTINALLSDDRIIIEELDHKEK